MPIWASSGRAACDAARYLRPRPHQRRDAGLFDRTLPRRARGRLGRLRRAAHPAREEGRPRAVERRAAAASLALSRDALLAVARARDPHPIGKAAGWTRVGMLGMISCDAAALKKKTETKPCRQL